MSKPSALPATRPAATPRSPPGAAGMKPGPPTIFRAAAAVAGTEWQVTDQGHRPRHPTMSCIAMPGPGSGAAPPRSPTTLANSPISARHAATAVRCHWHVENSFALHPRCHVPGGSVSYPSQSRRLRQATLLRLQHPASQSDFNVQSGSLRRRSRRCQRTPQVDLQLER